MRIPPIVVVACLVAASAACSGVAAAPAQHGSQWLLFTLVAEVEGSGYDNSVDGQKLMVERSAIQEVVQRTLDGRSWSEIHVYSERVVYGRYVVTATIDEICAALNCATLE